MLNPSIIVNIILPVNITWQSVTALINALTAYLNQDIRLTICLGFNYRQGTLGVQGIYQELNDKLKTLLVENEENNVVIQSCLIEFTGESFPYGKVRNALMKHNITQTAINNDLKLGLIPYISFQDSDDSLRTVTDLRSGELVSLNVFNYLYDFIRQSMEQYQPEYIYDDVVLATLYQYPPIVSFGYTPSQANLQEVSKDTRQQLLLQQIRTDMLARDIAVRSCGGYLPEPNLFVLGEFCLDPNVLFGDKQGESHKLVHTFTQAIMKRYESKVNEQTWVQMKSQNIVTSQLFMGVPTDLTKYLGLNNNSTSINKINPQHTSLLNNTMNAFMFERADKSGMRWGSVREGLQKYINEQEHLDMADIIQWLKENGVPEISPLKKGQLSRMYTDSSMSFQDINDIAFQSSIILASSLLVEHYDRQVNTIQKLISGQGNGDTRHQIAGDGHCFYRSVQHQAKADNSGHFEIRVDGQETLRNSIAQFITDHQEEFIAFFTSQQALMTEVQSIRNGGWAGPIAIRATAIVLNTNISVVNAHGEPIPGASVILDSNLPTLTIVHCNWQDRDNLGQLNHYDIP
ncbi:hypothetical protein C0J08_12125 [Marinomonas sp. CT5]|uniref:hypothetical protein n=1 Tax=Marinomonas sp. CT5 TaxID=2066133 RepID=UPI001BB0796D|nr:hypothetical protein [Marinomonas sp. CT5]QUX96109.1 hypothetical protein C0J08_12125 [Marinomonas sp. CT5]